MFGSLVGKKKLFRARHTLLNVVVLNAQPSANNKSDTFTCDTGKHVLYYNTFI